MSDEKHYDVRIPPVWCGQDLGLPLSKEVRAFLEGFHKTEILNIANEFDAKVARGEDPTYVRPVALAVEPPKPEPGQNHLENLILESVGEVATSVEVPVDAGVPIPEVPVKLEAPRVDEEPDADDYQLWTRDELYAEARSRKIYPLAPKTGHEALVKILRANDAKKN